MYMPHVIWLIRPDYRRREALWFTDFVQTFPAEVRAIWSRSLKGPSTLFILNRYSFLGYLILRLIVGEAKTPTASGYIYIPCFAALQVTIDNVYRCLLHDKLLNAFGTVSVVSAGREFNAALNRVRAIQNNYFSSSSFSAGVCSLRSKQNRTGLGHRPHSFAYVYRCRRKSSVLPRFYPLILY